MASAVPASGVCWVEFNREAVVSRCFVVPNGVEATRYSSSRTSFILCTVVN